MPSMVKKLITQRSANTPHFHIKRLFDSSVYSQCWATARKHAGCEPGTWGLLAKTLLSSCESKMCHSQTHWGKQFGCLRKTFWVLILSSQLSTFLANACLFWRNTVLGSPLQGSHLLKQSRVKKHCTVLEAPQREKPVHITSFMEKFCWFQVIISILEPYKEIHWVWICQLGTAGKKIVVTLWKQECFTFKPTW